jgi:hypothetical protein
VVGYVAINQSRLVWLVEALREREMRSNLAPKLITGVLVIHLDDHHAGRGVVPVGKL